MSEKQKLLSFCIPTYNRSKLVLKCVKNILSYVGDDIEVVVSDNASPDNTYELLSEIEDSRFKYYRNDKNVGANANILKVLEVTNCNFNFILSDEDEVNIDVIPKLIDIIKTNENASLILGVILMQDNQKYAVYGEHKFRRGNEAITNAGFTHHYMSGIIYNKKYLNLKAIYSEVIETGHIYPHMYMLTKLCNEGDVVTIDDIVCIQGKEEGAFNVELAKKLYTDFYFEPKSRFEQFEKDIKLLNKLNCDKYTYINCCLRLFMLGLYNSTCGFEFILYNKERKEKFEFDKEVDYNFFKEVNNFYNKVYNLCSNEIVDRTLFEDINTRMKEITNDFKTERSKIYIETFKIILSVLSSIKKSLDRYLIELKNDNITTYRLILNDMIMVLNGLREEVTNLENEKIFAKSKVKNYIDYFKEELLNLPCNSDDDFYYEYKRKINISFEAFEKEIVMILKDILS